MTVQRTSVVREGVGPMRVVTVDPTTDQLWERLLVTTTSDVFHAPGWLRVLGNTYGLPIEARILVDDTGAPLAGFVYSPIADLMDPRVVSLPFTDICDPLVSDNAQWAAVSEGVVEEGNRVHMRCLHNVVPLSDPLLTCTGRARWLAVDLTRPSDAIWGEIDSSARRSIRKARKEGVEVRTAEDIDDLRAFFDLHLRVRKNKYGLLAQPWPFFENIWSHLLSQGHGALMLAELGGELLGGVLFLEWGDTLYYKFNASDSEQLAVRPNDLLIWNGIEYALARGLRRLDFGLTDWDQEGLVRFKRKYATEEKTIHMLQHMPPGAPSDRELEARALLPQITELLTGTEIPDSVTARAGAILYRYFT